MLTLTRRSSETRRSKGATAGATNDVRRESVDAVLTSVDVKERERADKEPAAAETEFVAVAVAETAPTGLVLAALPVPACDGAAPGFITLCNDRELLFMPTSGVAAEDDAAGVSNDETGELAFEKADEAAAASENAPPKWSAGELPPPPPPPDSRFEASSEGWRA